MERPCYSTIYGDTKSDIMVIPVDGSAPARAIAEDPYTQWGPVMSPDGRWVAFVSNESGRDEIYVRSWSNRLAKWQVSNTGGLAPVWARDGRELYYLRGRMLVAVPVDIKAAIFPLAQRASCSPCRSRTRDTQGGGEL